MTNVREFLWALAEVKKGERVSVQNGELVLHTELGNAHIRHVGVGSKPVLAWKLENGETYRMATV